VEIVAGAIVIIVTAYLADKASERWRKWVWVLFVVLVLGQAGLQIHSRITSDRDHGKEVSTLQGSVSELGKQLQQSELARTADTAYLRAKLEDYAQFGPALIQLARTGEEYQRKQFENKIASNKELHELALSVAAKARELGQRYDQRENELSQERWKRDAQRQAQGVALSDATRQLEFFTDSDKMSQLRAAEESEFRQNILPDAMYLRDEFRRKGIKQPEMHPMIKSEVETAFAGLIVGPNPLGSLASYMETMARQIPTK